MSIATREHAEALGIGHVWDEVMAGKRPEGARNCAPGEPATSAPRAKYRNVPTLYKGIRYDSKAEAARAEELDHLQSIHMIAWWQPKPGSIRLGTHLNVYRPDFFVMSYRSPNHWYEDVKGKETPKFRKDRELWKEYGPTMLWIRKGDDVEVIVPKPMRARLDGGLEY